MKLKYILLILTAFLYSDIKAQNFKTDYDLPATPLNDTTNFALINSRLGSRFSFSLLNEKQSMQSGSMGFDMDDQFGLFVGLVYGNKTYCLRSTPLFKGAVYFKDEELRFGPASMQISGKTDDGMEVKFTVVSTFTKSKDLQDTAAIKVQICPAYYLLVNVKNSGNAARECTLKIGLAKTAVKTFNFMSADILSDKNTAQQIYFRDNASLDSKLVLKAIKTKCTRAFEKDGFGGLEYELNIKPGEEKSLSQVYATHNAGIIINDKRVNQGLRFYYNTYWKNLDEVVKYAENNFDRNVLLTQEFENALMINKLTPVEKWVLALSFHSDIANTFFLIDGNQKSRFYVSEGRFKHLSTVDVAHETEVNAVFCPWRLKLQLAEWTDYIAKAEVTVLPNPAQGKGSYQQGMTASEYGPFIYHDVGDLPFVSETANYNYGPHMAVEENTSFVLLLYWYWKITNDDAFVRSMLGTVNVLMQSVINRDTNGNGIADVAYGWTTYDVNEALKLSPDNTFLGTKQLCAYEVAAEMLNALANKEQTRDNETATKAGVVDGEGAGYKTLSVAVNNAALRKRQADGLHTEANKILNSLKIAQKKYGYIPVSLDEKFPKWNQRSVVLGEGLFLPGLAGCKSTILVQLAELLKKDYPKTYEQSVTSYGVKLTSGESPTWFSKTIVADVVAQYWYGIKHSTANYIYDWNKNNPFAYNDGLVSKGKVWTGYWYPRGISSLGYWLLTSDSKLYLNNAKPQ